MDVAHAQVDVQELADLFKVLGDPTRIRIVQQLLNKEMCVTDIAEAMGMGQSAISHQLRVLRQARLVAFRKEGKPCTTALMTNTWLCFSVRGLSTSSHQVKTE